MKQIILNIIRTYQKTCSPDHSIFGKQKYPYGFCRFTPSCSAYSYEAINKYGMIKGGYLAIWRICRCNPFSKGGFDPVK